MRINTNYIETILEKYKGINPSLFKDLEANTQKKLFKRTLKELCLLAESNIPGAGIRLIELITNNGTVELKDIESLIEYGKLYRELDLDEKRAVSRMEIQEEFGHFSRIMNLDNILIGNNKNNQTRTIDFSRFLDLLSERKSDRQKSASSSPKRPTSTYSFAITNCPSCGLLYEERVKNMVALLAVKKESESFKPREWLKEYSKLANRFDTKNSTLLFDYLLYLSNPRFNSAFVRATYSKQNDQNNTKISISGGGGCGVIITKADKNNPFLNKLVKKFSIGSQWNFGKQYQTAISNMNFKLKNGRYRLLCFHPESWKYIESLSNQQLEKLLNKTFKNGWTNPVNSIQNFLKSKGTVSEFGILSNRKIKESKITKYSYSFQKPLKNIVSTEEFTKLMQSEKTVIESCHIHADRDLGLEQENNIKVTKHFLNLLKNQGFSGKITNLSMVDDYHVVNRIDYKFFIEKTKQKGLNFQEIVPESSPIIRLIAIEILQRLASKEAKHKDWSIVIRGDNLYLEFPEKGVSIELIANTKSPTIGCILFDAAFCIYKSNIKHYSKAYNKKLNLKANQNLHNTLINYYKRESNPIKRRLFVEQYFNNIPKYEELLKGNAAIPKFPGEDAVLNILADFYKPQQKKVNLLLNTIGQNSIYTLYFNSETREVNLE